MQTQVSPTHADFGKVGKTELEERIRKCAYQLYVQRGYVDGYALDDWLEAKAEGAGCNQGQILPGKHAPISKAVGATQT